MFLWINSLNNKSIMSLKSYILTEQLKASHAAKFLEYEKHDHQKITRDLQSKLEKAWNKVASKFKPVELDAESKLFNAVDVSSKDVAIGRFGNRAVSTLSARVGALYDKNTKRAIKEALLAEAYSVLSATTTLMNQDVPGDPFVISEEDSTGEIRVKFKSGDYSKTIFLVAVESLQKFDRVYLRDFLDK